MMQAGAGCAGPPRSPAPAACAAQQPKHHAQQGVSCGNVARQGSLRGPMLVQGDKGWCWMTHLARAAPLGGEVYDSRLLGGCSTTEGSRR